MRPSFALLVLILVVGCGDQRPCASCPDISGPYLASWQNGFPLDGCPTQGPRPVNLNLTQMGNRVSALIDGQELRGTLFDTFDFSLSGGMTGVMNENQYSLLARAVVDSGGRTDGGVPTTKVRLAGSLTLRRGMCDLTERFTADRL
jgi:hypothetical protein